MGVRGSPDRRVHRWLPEVMPLVADEDVLGVESFATHHVPLEDAPAAYRDFQRKENGTVKVVFRP